MENNLQRFLKAQEEYYPTALSEIKSGRKRSHWIWFIFPQIKGIGHSHTSKYYAIQDLDEAKTYIQHPVLCARLKEISQELLFLDQTNANVIFGNPDDKKVKSCMTLFSVADGTEDNTYQKVLDKFFGGSDDDKTLKLMNWS